MGIVDPWRIFLWSDCRRIGPNGSKQLKKSVPSSWCWVRSQYYGKGLHGPFGERKYACRRLVSLSKTRKFVFLIQCIFLFHAMLFLTRISLPCSYFTSLTTDNSMFSFLSAKVLYKHYVKSNVFCWVNRGQKKDLLSKAACNRLSRHPSSASCGPAECRATEIVSMRCAIRWRSGSIYDNYSKRQQRNDAQIGLYMSRWQK